jgi:excisionase family DNA binding protein
MTTRRPRRTPEPGSKPAAGASPPPSVNVPAPRSPAERLAYSVDEAASLTGLSRDLLYDQMRSGNLRYIKIGRRRLITRQDLEQFLEITQGPDHPHQAAEPLAAGRTVTRRDHGR